MSLTDIGLSGIKAHSIALQATGNNIVNANTEGYSRQRVIFEENIPRFIGVGYLGQGVHVADIQRLADEFATTQAQGDQALLSELEIIRRNIDQIDDILADPSTGLAPVLNNFFAALQSAADDPSSIPQRQVLLSRAEALTDRMNSLYDRVQKQSLLVNQEIETQVGRINSLAQSLAELNAATVAATGNATGKGPNDLSDQRATLLKELNKLTGAQAIQQPDGQVNVLIGNGQALVTGKLAKKLEVLRDDNDPNRVSVGLQGANEAVRFTRNISGGGLGGNLRFRNEVLDETLGTLGRISLSLADTINRQHELGIDLDNEFGGPFFEDINTRSKMSGRVFPASANAGPNDRVVLAEIIDTQALTTRAYNVEFSGPSARDITVSDANTGETVLRSQAAGSFPAEIEFDGVRLHLESGSFQIGDRFRVTPAATGVKALQVAIDRPEDIALALPIRALTDSGNRGEGTISQGEMLALDSVVSGDPLATFANPQALSPPVLVRFLSDTVYEVLDNSDPLNPVPLDPPLNNQTFIRGVENEIFSRDPGQTIVTAGGTTLSQLPLPAATATGNGYIGQTVNVRTRDPETGLFVTASAVLEDGDSAATIAGKLSDLDGVAATAYTEVLVENFVDGGTLPASLAINGTVFTPAAGDGFDANALAGLINDPATPEGQAMLEQGIFARVEGGTLQIRNQSGEDILVSVSGDPADSVDLRTERAPAQTLSAGTAVQVGGQIQVRLADQVTLRATSNTIFDPLPPAIPDFRGYTATLGGTPVAGDEFRIEFNADGVSDNRNALAMASLQTAGTMQNGQNTFSEAYSQLVGFVGSAANQAMQDEQSAASLLKQSENRIQEISGVNLDEEAALLIQYQAAYQASAQVVSVSRQLFDTLLAAFR